MKPHEIIDIITDLNCELYEQTHDDQVYLEYSTNGFADIVEFRDIILWNSEDDFREYVDEENDIKEDMKSYLIKELNRNIKILNKIDLVQEN